MKKCLRLAVPALVAVLAAAAFGVSQSAKAAPAASAVTCKSSATVGYMGPTTGPVASIGAELRQWPLFYISQWNATHKLKIKVVEGDDQFDPSQASTIAQQFSANRNILGVLGPGSSPEVVAASPLFKKSGMPYIAATATRTTLTNGENPGFFRIAPPDSVQAATTVDYMTKVLKVKKVAIFDDQSAYSAPLASAVEAGLKAAGVSVSHSSVSQNQSDYSSTVTNIASDTQLVYLPFTVPAKMQLFGQQMAEQGKNAKLFVGDAGYSTEFHINGAYFSTFAPDIRDLPQDKGLINAFFKKYGSKAPLTTYGPPSYVAAQAMIAAIAKACKDGKATRAEVKAAMLKTTMKTSILGHGIRFTPRGDVVGAQFVIFQIQNGKPHVVKK
jgi:branched-chain amino acid transport system substrate-binding protein